MMSRFKIQTQSLISSAFYLALVLGTVALSILIKDNLATLNDEEQRLLEQVVVLDSMKEDIDQGMIDALLLLDGNPNAFDSLSSNIDEVFAEAPHAEQAMMSADLPAVQSEQSWHSVAEALGVLETVQGRLSGFNSLAEAEQTQLLRDEIFPLLSRTANSIDDVRDERHAFRALNNERKTAILERSQRNFYIIGLVAALTSALLAIFFGRSISRPILAVSQSVSQLQDGAYHIPIPQQDRRDEVGDINVALEALRGHLSETHAHQLQEATINTRRTELFEALGARMAEVSNGQLDARMDASAWQDLGEVYVRLCEDFNHLGANFASIVGSVRDSAVAVEGNSKDLSGMSNDMSRRAEVQAATLEQSAAALAQMSAGVKAAATRAQQADALVLEGRQKAEAGGAVMEQALAAMGSIAHASEQINDIIGVIDDIAFQTNLLALNAGVEAARAGPSGKGFSVVASEVRSLAQRASESAKEIKTLVSESARRVEDGGELVEKTSKTLMDIVSTVNEVASMVSDVATSAREQATGLEEINVGVGELDRVTQENVASVTQLSAASSGLNAEASRMTSMLAQFGAGGEHPKSVSMPRDSGAPLLSSSDVAVEPTMADLPAFDATDAFAPAAPSIQNSTPPAKRVVGAKDASVWEEF